MSKLLFDSGYIDDVEAFVRDIYLREAQGVTGIGNGIAIPHGKSASAKQPEYRHCYTESSIEWETLDEKDVDTVFPVLCEQW